jgi:Uma2 family endonuclease
LLRRSLRRKDREKERRGDSQPTVSPFALRDLEGFEGLSQRADIAIFCERPSETDAAVTAIPEAVIEIISRGYEKKDLELGPPFYLSQGVKDVFVFDPYTEVVRHFASAADQTYPSPYTLTLQCGCQVTI